MVSNMITEPNDISFHSGAPAGVDHMSMNLGVPSLKARNLRISLKQWRMFHAVIDSDGFFGAADSLNVTQSTVSHAVAKLQDQLGVPLLVLNGRKAQITDEGRILLERSRHLIRHAIELEKLAENLRQGWGPEIHLASDPIFPAELLPLALRKFSFTPPKVKLRVRQATHEQVRYALQNSSVDLAITTQVTEGFVGTELIKVEHVAVAHPASLLFALKRDITSDELRTQCQVIISDVDDYVATEASYRLSLFSQVWNVSSLDLAFRVLRQGIGYAWLPRHQVQQALTENQVRILPLVGGSSFTTTLYLVYARSVAPDSVTGRFAERLQTCSRCYQENTQLPARAEPMPDPECCGGVERH